MPIFTSPFPTTHDTIGASTADSPVHVPSSPVTAPQPHNGVENGHEESTINDNAGEETNKRSSQTSSFKGLAVIDLDQKLAQYSIDFNKFPGGSKDNEHAAPEEEDPVGHEFGGPEDLTMNLDKYLLGDVEGKQTHDNDDDDDSFELEDDDDLPDSPSPLPRQHHEMEESEFGPPIDMSTPSQFMWKKNVAGLSSKEETFLEDIQESFASSPEKSTSPTKHSGKDEELGRSRTFTTVIREIEDLHEQRRERDERIRISQEKLAAATEMNEYLRAELNRKSLQLADANAKVGEEAILREQIQVLRKKNEERLSSDSGLADQLTILREQLDSAHEQLKKKDEALEDSTARIRELTATKEQQLREKNTEIEDLKAQVSERDLEMASLDEELADVKQEYAVIETRIAALETRNGPLEEKNILLDKEVNRVKSELVAQRNSLSIMATELSIETDGKTYNDIINSLKTLHKTKQPPPAKQDGSAELEDLRSNLAKAEAEAHQHATAKQTIETEWKQSQETLAESRSFMATVEAENTRLTARLQELSSNLAATREALRLYQEKHANSPPPTIPDTTRQEIQTLKEAHAHAIADLRASYTSSTTTLRSLLSSSETREADLHSQLHTLRTTTSTQASQISSLTSQITDLEATLAVKEETSVELDRRISRAIEKREREWERRIDILLKEREKMSKALMWAWGEKEVGKKGGGSKSGKEVEEMQSENGTGQGYRYKYVVR